MHLADRIEKRRFVGREFLLWIWFESELFEGTLATKEHGELGLWVEKHIVLTAGKEATRITGSQPAAGREAKESLRRGKLPDAAAFHLVQGDRECSFTLKAEQLGIVALRLPTVLGGDDEEAPAPPDAPRAPRRRRKETRAEEERRVDDEQHESFYERMRLTRDFEGLIEALYRDFLALRLGPGWAQVTEAMRAWIAGEDVDVDRYRARRDAALGADDDAPVTRRAKTEPTRRAQRRPTSAAPPPGDSRRAGGVARGR